MTERWNDTNDARVLLVLPTKQDAVLTGQLLAEANVTCVACDDLDHLNDELLHGAGALLISYERLFVPGLARLHEIVAAQPSWSDLPMLVMVRGVEPAVLMSAAMSRLGNVTLLDRPMSTASLVSAVQSALRARRRQYEARAHLAELERTATALRATQESLREADRRKDEFLATLAHELRNPLAPLRNSLHLLQMNDGEDPAIRRLEETMDRQLSQLIRLVDDLLEVSRITRGKLQLREEVVELSRVLTGAVETSRPLLDAAGHHFELELPDEPLRLRGDPVRLAQIFSNLLNNAAKYTPDGGRVTLSARREGDEVVVCVTDNGIGIPSELRSRVFDLFMQVDRSTHRAKGGLGIGLTLVRTLVEMHHGTITLDDGDGDGETGCTFAVRLPLLPAEVDGRAAAPATPTRNAARRILIVDDNVDAAQTMAMLLKHLGAETRTAHGGAAVVEAVADFHPHIVLLDLGMPEVDGFEAARRVRASTEFDDVVLIALTGWGQESDRRRTEEAGFDHHLVKPVDLPTLQTIWTVQRRR